MSKGYRLHTISTSTSGSVGLGGGDRIQATMVFERIYPGLRKREAGVRRDVSRPACRLRTQCGPDVERSRFPLTFSAG